MPLTVPTIALQKIFEEKVATLAQKKDIEHINALYRFLENTVPLQSNYLVGFFGEDLHQFVEILPSFRTSSITLKHHLLTRRLQDECKIVLSDQQRDSLVSLLE